jgi:alpha-beta hydrolase superfamily lysophospholipase
MAQMLEEDIEGTKGIKIHLRSWRPNGRPRAVMVLVHGFNSHSGQYAWASEQFVAHGLVAYAPDLRGRGKSEGERFFVGNYADYVSDVASAVHVAKTREPGLPVFLLGHSAGGVIACVYTLDNQSELAGFICESFAQQAPAPDFVLAAIKGVSRIAPRVRVFKLNNADFSRDPNRVAEMNRDPLIADEGQPAGTIAELLKATERLKHSFPRITLPVFIIHGTLDKATRPSGSQFFFDTVGSKDKTLKLYEGHYHDLLADAGKEGVMRDIRDWIDKRLPAA